MEVTQKNYDEFLVDFKQHFPKCDYYSIDFEMTGIKCLENEYVTDLPCEKYAKLRHAANKYRIIQMGVCLFTQKDEKHYEARPYNIYLFPREDGYFSPQISIDVSAAEFNTQHGMNWNKWFSEGITYLNLKQIKKIKQEAEKNDSIYFESEPLQLSKEEDILKSKELIQNLEAWIASNSQEPFIVTGENSFWRRYAYGMLRKDYPQLIFETVSRAEKNSDKDIYVYNLKDKAEKEAYYDKKSKEKEEQFNRQIGFTQVIQYLIDSKKPLIGHNCYFDILFLYSHFIEQLPYKFTQFKERMNEFFPEVYDTKFMVHNTQFKNKLSGASSLGILAELCLNKEDKDFADIQITLDENFKAYDFEHNKDLSRCHEAGYDAFLTGFAFTKMFFTLTPEEKLRLKNSVNSMKCLYYLKLDKPEDLMYRKYVIYLLQQAPKAPKFNSAEILAKFEDVQLNELIRIIQIAQGGFQGVMIILEPLNEEHAKQFEEKIEKIKKEGTTVLTYSAFSQIRLERYEKGEKE